MKAERGAVNFARRKGGREPVGFNKIHVLISGSGSLAENPDQHPRVDEHPGAVGRSVGPVHADDARPHLFQVHTRMEHQSGKRANSRWSF